jgi:hypothetical protein
MLYGVTMEEHGVSKLVSVKFTDKGHEPQLQNPSIAESFGKSGELGGSQAAAGASEPEQESMV